MSSNGLNHEAKDEKNTRVVELYNKEINIKKPRSNSFVYLLIQYIRSFLKFETFYLRLF